MILNPYNSKYFLVPILSELYETYYSTHIYIYVIFLKIKTCPSIKIQKQLIINVAIVRCLPLLTELHTCDRNGLGQIDVSVTGSSSKYSVAVPWRGFLKWQMTHDCE